MAATPGYSSTILPHDGSAGNPPVRVAHAGHREQTGGVPPGTGIDLPALAADCPPRTAPNASPSGRVSRRPCPRHRSTTTAPRHRLAAQERPADVVPRLRPL